MTQKSPKRRGGTDTTNDPQKASAPVTFRDLAELNVQPLSPSSKYIFTKLFSSFWIGEYPSISFALREYFAHRNQRVSDINDRFNPEDFPEFESPSQSGSLGYRRYVYEFLNLQTTTQLPPLREGIDGETAAYEELARWRFEDYPPEFLDIMENISITRETLSDWLTTHPDIKFQISAPRITSRSTDDQSQISQETLATTTADISLTGDPGRPPKLAHLYHSEFKRRTDNGEASTILAEEARHLVAWCKNNHPEAPQPSPRTIENRIRESHRDYRNRSMPQN